MRKTNSINDIRNTAKAFLELDVEDANFAGIVYHPIFESCVFPDENMNLLNILEEDGLKKAREIISKQIDTMKAEQIFYVLIRRPYRLIFLKYVQDYLTEKTYADWLANAWIDSENPNIDRNLTLDDIKEMFLKADRKYLMNKHENEKFRNLPEVMTLYRGIGEKSNPNGFAWTWDMNVAAWFANRFNEGYIVQAEIPKERVLAIFDRGESEIVCDTRGIKKTKL